MASCKCRNLPVVNGGDWKWVVEESKCILYSRLFIYKDRLVMAESFVWSCYYLTTMKDSKKTGDDGRCTDSTGQPNVRNSHKFVISQLSRKILHRLLVASILDYCRNKVKL